MGRERSKNQENSLCAASAFDQQAQRQRLKAAWGHCQRTRSQPMQGDTNGNQKSEVATSL